VDCLWLLELMAALEPIVRELERAATDSERDVCVHLARLS